MRCLRESCDIHVNFEFASYWHSPFPLDLSTIVFLISGSYSSSDDRTGSKERHMGGAAELSLSNQLDVKTREDLWRRPCPWQHTQRFQAMAHQLPVTRLSRLYSAKWLVSCYVSLHVSVRRNCISDLGKEILKGERRSEIILMD